MPFGFFFLKPKKNADSIKNWLKLQSHYEDAIIYLIEKEIFENGLRDLSYIIPGKRNNEYFEGLFAKSAPKNDYYNSFMTTEQQTNIKNDSSVKEFTTKSVNSGSVNRIPSKPADKIVKDTAIDFPSNEIFIAESKKADFSNVDLGCYDD